MELTTFSCLQMFYWSTMVYSFTSGPEEVRTPRPTSHLVASCGVRGIPHAQHSHARGAPQIQAHAARSSSFRTIACLGQRGVVDRDIGRGDGIVPPAQLRAAVGEGPGHQGVAGSRGAHGRFTYRASE